MMVHSWTTQHIRLSYKDKISGKEGYLDPTVSTFISCILTPITGLVWKLSTEKCSFFNFFLIFTSIHKYIVIPQSSFVIVCFIIRGDIFLEL